MAQRIDSQFWDNENFQGKLNNTLCLDDANSEEVDGRLVTGQNPASAAGVGAEVVKLLS